MLDEESAEEISRATDEMIDRVYGMQRPEIFETLSYINSVLRNT